MLVSVMEKHKSGKGGGDGGTREWKIGLREVGRLDGVAGKTSPGR